MAVKDHKKSNNIYQNAPVWTYYEKIKYGLHMPKG